MASPDGLLRADAALAPRPSYGPLPQHRARIVLEVDGPSHFLLPSRRARGRSVVRERLARERGWLPLVVDLDAYKADPVGEMDAFEAALEAALRDVYGPPTSK